MPGTVWLPYVQCTIAGQQPAQQVTGARVEASFADPVSRGYVSFRETPPWGHGDELTITMGNGINNVLRFTGTIFQGDYLNSGPSRTLVARGPLYRVQKFRNQEPKGLGLLDLTQGPATDEAIVRAVLDRVGVSYSSGNIGGTGILRGTLAAEAYRWRYGESALDYIQRLAKASLGYRLIESIGGDIYRVQVYGRPSGAADYFFTEGIDIFEGVHTQRSTFERYQAVRVTGFDYGDGLGPVAYAVPESPGSGTDVYTFSSEMIEKTLIDGDPKGDDGVSCEAVVDYLFGEVDRETVKVSSLSTPRDEVIGPGNTLNVNSALTGVEGEGLWVLGVTNEVDDVNYTQTFELIGGGEAPGGYTGP